MQEIPSNLYGKPIDWLGGSLPWNIAHPCRVASRLDLELRKLSPLEVLIIAGDRDLQQDVQPYLQHILPVLHRNVLLRVPVRTNPETPADPSGQPVLPRHLPDRLAVDADSPLPSLPLLALHIQHGSRLREKHLELIYLAVDAGAQFDDKGDIGCDGTGYDFGGYYA